MYLPAKNLEDTKLLDTVNLYMKIDAQGGFFFVS